MLIEPMEKWQLDVESIIFEDVRVTEGNAPKFVLDGSEVDIWSEPYIHYHSKTPVEYIQEAIAACDKKGIDAFPDIVGKAKEKELVKEALFSGSPILFRGEKGYGKTTFSKAIAKLLPEKLLTIKGCKIHDDPTRPVCFSCKAKVLFSDVVELAWVPRIWVRIPGDPMLTTRQLIGGISIQKIREGYDLDHPEVFIPGRALKAHRGVGYFDELGAVPTALQTLLHELFEEHQVTSTEGDIVPFKLSTIEIASTNPANYRGTTPIKEPLLDRMEVIEIGPPESLEEEIEIARKNTFLMKTYGRDPRIPIWHMKILARTVRFGRKGQGCEVAKKIRSEPSCRATIKLFDHIKSRTIRSNREIPLLRDYGERFEVVQLALAGRIEVEYGVRERVQEIVNHLFEEALERTCREVYNQIPDELFDELIDTLISIAFKKDGEYYLPIKLDYVKELKNLKPIEAALKPLLGGGEVDDETYLSAFEILLHSISICAPRYVARKGEGYVVRKVVLDEAGMRSLP